MKKLLLPLLLIAALPVFAQRGETEYRINRIFSAGCGREQLFLYEGESTIPICVKRISELSDYVYLDSLRYNDLGQLVEASNYVDYYGTLEFNQRIEYSYNEKGLRIKGEVYSAPYEGSIYHESTVTYTYDDNDRMIVAEVSYVQDDWHEKMDFIYNDEGLRVEDRYSCDYGDGDGYITEEITRFYYENGLMVKEEYYYHYAGTDYLESEYSYEYDEHGNCISMTEYYDGYIDYKIEYHHNLDVSSDDVYIYSDHEDIVYLTPPHHNMITGYTQYYTDENYELHVDCIYEYEYDEMVSVEENSIAFNVYPNPANDFINIEAENIDFVELYDIFGRKLYSEENSGHIKIDMSNYSNGIYFVKLYSEGNTSVKKILKNE